MDRKRKVLGKTLSCTALEALLLLEASCCEGIILPAQLSPPGVEQMFGRKTQFHHSKDISFMSGLAAGGLRTAAFIHASSLTGNLNRLREMARNHIPALIICLTDWSATGRAPVTALKDSGCFIFSASSAQEAVHLALTAHLVSEQALIPGILLLEFPADETANFDIVFPKAEIVAALLGDPDEPLASPNLAQQMLFGKNRRRVPNWYHFDYPTLTGADKTGLPAALETAANAQFFGNPLSNILDESFERYQSALPEAEVAALCTHKTKDAEYLLLTAGGAYTAANAVAARLRSDAGMRTGCAHLAQLHPLPRTALGTLLAGKKAVTWLDPCQNQNELLSFETLQSLSTKTGKSAPEWFRARLSARPEPEALTAIFLNMSPKGDKKRDSFSGVGFVRMSSAYPQHEVLLQNIRRDFPEASKWSLQAGTSNSGPHLSAHHSHLPLAIRRQKDLSPPYARIARFYHDMAAPFADGAYDELVADPFQAIPLAPVGTGGLASEAAERLMLPVFKPGQCTGCGECLVHCPHAALPPLVINIEQMLRGAMEIAGKRGTPVSQLTPLLKNLGRIAGQLVSDNTVPLQKVAEFLPEAFSRLASQMNMDPEKTERTGREIEILGEILAPLSVAATQTFFTQSEQQEKGSGELFTIALDTQACTGCGICAAVCEPMALEMTAESPDLREQAAATLDLWEQLPDTAPSTILRRRHDTHYNPFASILLSRHNYCTMTGPGNAASAPRKTLIHWLTALTESLVQPNVAAQCREIEQLIEDLSGNIHKILGDALPADGSSALEDAIKAADGRKLPLEEIMGKLSSHAPTKLVDTASIQRKIQLENELKDLLWSLKEGPTGAGRARYGLFFPGEQSASDEFFPFNPFQSPARISQFGSAEMVLGMFEANLRHSIDNIRLLRRAKLEIKNQYRPELQAEAIAGLDWNQLEDAEKNLVAPQLLICRREHLPDNFIGQLPHILAQNYPIKIIVLDNAALRPEEPPEIIFGLRNVLLQVAQSSVHSSVFMGSAGDPQALFNGLLRGLATKKPALFVLYCPEPALHTMTAQTKLPQLALNSRAVPFFQWNPEQAGLTRAQGISIQGNPSAHEAWTVSANGDETQLVTFADWLFSLTDWQHHFRQLAENDPRICVLPKYLALDAALQEGKVAVVYQQQENSAAIPFAVSDQVLDACRAGLSAWNYLREIAGALSMHPQKLWEEAETVQADRYEIRLREMEMGFEDRIRHLEREFLEKTRRQLREKLVTLARQNT